MLSTKTNALDGVECKVRGITLNHDAVQCVNFDAMRGMVQRVDPTNGRAWKKDGDEMTVPVHYPHRIQRDGPGVVRTKAITKDYRLVYTKRVILPDLTTLPYGF